MNGQGWNQHKETQKVLRLAPSPFARERETVDDMIASLRRRQENLTISRAERREGLKKS